MLKLLATRLTSLIVDGSLLLISARGERYVYRGEGRSRRRSLLQQIIMPLLAADGVEYIGEIDERQKAQFLRSALGLLFPIDWPEPFGLVMIEAMACGTPVLVFNCGAVPEVNQGVTGFIVNSIDEAIERLAPLLALDRRSVRRRFEQRFAADRMATDYVRGYEQQIGGRQQSRRNGRSPGPLREPPAADALRAEHASAPASAS